MKKKIFPLMVAGTLLVGCGSSSAVNYSSEVSDGDKKSLMKMPSKLKSMKKLLVQKKIYLLL